MKELPNGKQVFQVCISNDYKQFRIDPLHSPGDLLSTTLGVTFQTCGLDMMHQGFEVGARAKWKNITPKSLKGQMASDVFHANSFHMEIAGRVVI